ncbi:hypothetical protein [Mobilicoccus pelagius]|uniref:Hydrolase n=1 Tax=Mobilicoccus pelagius NBRC 104925 TaxID=1089455 RepID=H5UT89_9MICO|nr:hypothetical protein [Mobilicoccus pelagius]GAB48947.1 hypothetical protein MOPEL_086_00100 [Mobilicoccus pelagius NBRC 104925]
MPSTVGGRRRDRPTPASSAAPHLDVKDAVERDGDRTAAVTPRAPASHQTGAAGAADDVDATGRFVVPGLIDTHAHLLGREHLDAMAGAG